MTTETKAAWILSQAVAFLASKHETSEQAIVAALEAKNAAVCSQIADLIAEGVKIMAATTPFRFATKEQAVAAAVGRYAGFVAVFIHSNVAAAHKVPQGGWYLIHGRGVNEVFAK